MTKIDSIWDDSLSARLPADATIDKYFIFDFQILKYHLNFKNTPKVSSRGQSIFSNFQFQIQFNCQQYRLINFLSVASM
tara:strand:+ start:4620 stop:4856 length:237 start_codon:yes stop_codon:yes gene_type:complete